MRVQQGDTVIRVDNPRVIGLVERRSGDTVTIRLPEENNRREQVYRDEVRPLAEAMQEARERGTRFRNGLSLTGASTLAELVAVFGYATERLRQESLRAVRKQLERAGLEVRCSTDRWTRDDLFSLVVRDDMPPEPPEPPPAEGDNRALVEVSLPDPFWPTAMGLEANREIAFLRALTAQDPLLCLLHVPDDSVTQRWLQPTFEGMASETERREKEGCAEEEDACAEGARCRQGKSRSPREAAKAGRAPQEASVADASVRPQAHRERVADPLLESGGQ